MNRLKVSITLLVGAIGLGLVSGCGPALIRSFDVLPRTCCPGDEVQITWETDGDTTLQANPEVRPPLGAVDRSGSETRTVNETTTFIIRAAGAEATSEQSITVAVVPADGMHFTFATTGSCVNGAPQWVIVNPPNEWAEGVTVNTVRNTSGRDVNVAHGATSVALGSNGETALFAGQPASGDWIMSTVVLPLDNPCPPPGGEEGELRPQPGDGNRPPPLPELRIEVEVICSR